MCWRVITVYQGGPSPLMKCSYFTVAELMSMYAAQGGMPGAERLRDCESLTKLLSRQAEVKKPLGAICAAPAVVFEAQGLLKVGNILRSRSNLCKSSSCWSVVPFVGCWRFTAKVDVVLGGRDLF